MTEHFDLLKQQIPTLQRISGMPGEVGFFAQEAMRFYSTAGSLCATFPLNNSSIEERQITHILARSLLENYFWLIYIFDDRAQRSTRYNEKLNAFKREYAKLLNDPLVPHKSQLEPAGPDWGELDRPPDLNSMLTKVKNVYGDNLSYLYFFYRVASFDTHGNSLAVLFEMAFGKICSFPALKLPFGFDLIANQYLCILQELHNAGEI